MPCSRLQALQSGQHQHCKVPEVSGLLEQLILQVALTSLAARLVRELQSQKTDAPALGHSFRLRACYVLFAYIVWNLLLLVSTTSISYVVATVERSKSCGELS